MRILIVEDEPKVARALQQGLEAEHYEVLSAHTGEEGFQIAVTLDLDLVVLDVMLPGRSGLEVLAAWRQQDMKVPVLLLTAMDAVQDRVKGLDTGADDYLVKPFAIAEFLARVRALLRRGRVETPHRLALADLSVDVTQRKANRCGRNLELTSREFEVLVYLLRHQSRIVSRAMLARDVWKETARHTPLDNVIDVHMTRLRRKLDEPFARKLLHTVRGVGFVLREEHE